MEHYGIRSRCDSCRCVEHWQLSTTEYEVGAIAASELSKLNNKIKSAQESAKVFIQNGKTKGEIKAAQEELKANLNKKYGEKIKARQLAKIKQEYTQRELDKLNKLL